MNVSNSKSKRKEEGCGKWLTTKSKAKVPLQFAPCVTIFKPIITEPPRNKKRKMKQSTMSQFLVGSTILKTRNVKKHENNSHEKLSSFKVPVVLPIKRRRSSEPCDDEDLWGSDSDENGECEIIDNLRASQGNKQNLLESDIQLHKNTETNANFKNMGKNEDHKATKTKKLFPLPKKVKKLTDSWDRDNGKEIINLTRNEVQFTEWFENEVDAFIEHHNEKQVLHKEKLLPSCKLSDSEEATSAPQFSEWFNKQIQEVDRNELPLNILQSRTSDVS